MIFRKLKEPIFNLFYIMTEGVVGASGAALERKVIFLLFIDVLQVLRVMCSYRYGWTSDTTQIFKYTDLVYLFTNLISQLIPRYCFFILAAFLVVVALMDSYYVVKLFTSGNVQKLWPVKLLRLLVGALVTTLFSSVIKWLLIPVECLASKEKSFSSFVHNEEDLCTPWALPELIVSIPTILLAAAYIIFALGTSYLAFEINPLSMHPRAMYTGRVEMLFTANKVAVTVLVYFSEYVTPVAVALVFFLWTYTVFRKHLIVLPFHSTVTNNVRGGIYGMVLWFSLSTVVVSSLEISRDEDWDAVEPPGWVQPLQWGLVAVLPLAFWAGFLVTLSVQYRLDRTIQRLRGDFERQVQQSSGAHHSSKSSDDFYPARSGGLLPHTQSASSRPMGVTRGAFDKFFDTAWESRRRFTTEWKAVVTLRHLLKHRSLQDMAFLQFLVGKAVEEHPESRLLEMLVLVLNRFVFRDPTEAAAVEKGLKLNSKALPIDLQYILFSAERKSNQAVRGADLGQQGAVSGISLMEFEVSMEKARKAHMACLTKMKDFWRRVKMKRQTPLDALQAEEMVQGLDEHEHELAVAKREYALLIEKYPQSVQVLRTYAQFCNTVLNDYKQAEAKQKQASMLDGEDPDADGEEDEEAAKQNMRSGASSCSSESGEPYRLQIRKFLDSQRELMVGEEAKTVKALHRRVQLALMVLITLASTGFVVMDFYLFNDVAKQNIELIDKTGLFRAYSISSNFLLRSAFLAAFANNTEGFAGAAGKITGAMKNLRRDHFSNYDNIQSKGIEDFYLLPDKHADIPVENTWLRRTYNYWDLANDFSRRVGRTSEVSQEELLDPNFVVGEISENKANIAYAFENTQTVLIPTFERMVKLYEEAVFGFGELATAFVIGNTALNGLVVFALAFFVLRALVKVLRTIESNYVFTAMAISLPRQTAMAFYKYYDQVELDMRIVEDEEEERRAMMGNTGDDKNLNLVRGASSGGSFKDKEEAPVIASANAQLTFEQPRSMMEATPPPFGAGASEAKRSGSPILKTALKTVNYKMSSEDVPAEVDGPRVLLEPQLPVTMTSALTFDNLEILKSEQAAQQQHKFEKKEKTDQASEGSDEEGSQPGIGEETKNNIMRWLIGEDQPPPRPATPPPAPATIGEGSRPRAGTPPPAAVTIEEGRQPRPGTPPRGMGNKMMKMLSLPLHTLERTPDVDEDGRRLMTAREPDDDEQEELPSMLSPRHMSELVLVSREATPRVGGVEEEEDEDEDEDELGGLFARTGSAEEVQDVAEQGAKGKGGSPFGRAASLHAHWVDEDGDAGNESPVAVLHTPVLHGHDDHEHKSILRASKRRVSPPFLADADGNEEVEEPHKEEESERLEGGVHASDKEESWRPSVHEAAPVAKSPLHSIQARGKPPAGASHHAANEGRPEGFVEESMKSLLEVTKARLHWFSRVEVYAVVLVIVLGLCVLSVLYPARQLDLIVNMAPTTNQAGRRRYLVRSCVHFTRELVLDDGFSRMHRSDIASALQYHLDELRDADAAVRRGGSHEISLGADERNPEHNTVMYAEGCPWREDPEDCSTPGMPGRGDVNQHGLQYLLTSFYDAIELVLARYSGPGHTFSMNFRTHEDVVASSEFTSVSADADRVKLLSSDDEVKFILTAFAGDVFNGLGLILNLFHDETAQVLEQAHLEIQLLFAIYVSFTIFGFYVVLFRNTVKLASAEVERARESVFMMPLHILKTDEVHHVVSFIATPPANEEEDQDGRTESTHGLLPVH